MSDNLCSGMNLGYKNGSADLARRALARSDAREHLQWDRKSLQQLRCLPCNTTSLLRGFRGNTHDLVDLWNEAHVDDLGTGLDTGDLPRFVASIER